MDPTPHRDWRSQQSPFLPDTPPSVRCNPKMNEGLRVKPGRTTRLAVHHRLQFLGKRGLSHFGRRRSNLHVKHTAKALAVCGDEGLDGGVNAGVGEWTGGCMDEQTTKLYSLPQF